jgi:excinuclease ABC subunit C
VDLKARVRSYFSGGDKRPFVKRLPGLLGDIEIIVTQTDEEAWRLEASLIRRHRPKYNIAIAREGVWLRLDPKGFWPTLGVVRRPERDGARYFGEYASWQKAYSIRDLVDRYFQLRTCDDATLRNRVRPCLQYQIKRCLAPCALEVAKEKYDENVNDVILFLEGRNTELRTRLEERMWGASEGMEFEAAARYRDQLKAVDGTWKRYEVDDAAFAARDVVGLWREGERATFYLLALREGQVRESESFHFTDQEFSDEEILAGFLPQLYLSGREVPPEVIIPFPIEGAQVLGRVLGEELGQEVSVVWPPGARPPAAPTDDEPDEPRDEDPQGADEAPDPQGDEPPQEELGEAPAGGDEAFRARLLGMATRNALHAFQRFHGRKDRAQEQLAKLQARLGLWRAPKRIECFDVSNLQETAQVGGMVVFLDGEPAPKEYRSFHLQQTTQDDFGGMREMIERRFRRAVSGQWPAPDLVVIDGGKGQLSAAKAILDDLGLDAVPIVALAKSRRVEQAVDEPTGASQGSRTPERVFVVGRKNPLVIPRRAPELLLLQRVRDETHDHALRCHRRLRARLAMRGTLEQVEGIGPARKKALLVRFGSLEAIAAATQAELLAVPGVTLDLVARLRDFFEGEASER